MDRGIDVNSVADVVGTLAGSLERTGPQRGLWERLWFRGQADASWRLAPKVQRDDFVGQATRKAGRTVSDPKFTPDIHSNFFEKELIREFRRLSAISGGRPDDGVVATYLAAQHAGLPTRLLDWTLSSAVALFFAVSDEPSRDGALFGLATNRSLECQRGTEPVRLFPPILPNSPLVRSIVGELFNYGEPADTALWFTSGSGDWLGVIPIMPDLAHGRLQLQASCFTLHAPGSGALEEARLALFKCIVPAASKPRIRAELRELGIHRASLFGDLDSVAQDLVDQFYERD